MQILDTSLKAYYEKVKGTLGNRQKVVFEKMQEKDNWSNSELAEAMHWTINCITGRVNELRKNNLVEDAGKRRCNVTGEMVHSWRVTTTVKPILSNKIPVVDIFVTDHIKNETK